MGTVKSIKKRLKQFTIILIVMIVLLGGTALTIDNYVERVGTRYILKVDEVPASDAILVLGAYVFPDGTASSMLNDRLDQGYELYQKGKAPKILVSGDHGRKDYDEVNAMKRHF